MHATRLISLNDMLDADLIVDAYKVRWFDPMLAIMQGANPCPQNYAAGARLGGAS